MAQYKSDIVDVNLNTGNIHRSYLNHSIGQKDDDADRFGIRAFRDGVPQDLSGCSCHAWFTNSQGTTLALTEYGTVDGNEAYVTLPQACYDYDGQFCLAIKLVGGGISSTVRIIDGMVDNIDVGGAVSPTSEIPDYSDILAQYDAMVAATSAANTAIAATYSSSSTYKVGDYCIHDGGLYRCTTAITTAEVWTAGHWTAAKIGPDVSDLKSAMQDDWFLTDYPGILWEKGNISTTGNNATSNYVIRTNGLVPCEESVLLKLDLLGLSSTNVCFAFFYNGSGTFISNSRKSLINPLGITPPAGAAYCRITFGYTSASGIVIEDVSAESAKCKIKLLYGLNKKVNDIYNNSAVTPQMFGAVADGVHDDTKAFQAAVDSGGNVFVPTNHHEIYRITQTITIPNTCKCIYGTGQWRTAATYGGYVNFDLKPLHDSGGDYTINYLRKYALFELESAGSVMITGIKFTCDKVLAGEPEKAYRVGYFVSGMSTERVDYDFRLENVQVGGFYRGIRMVGRGCEVYNSQFNSMNELATFMWDHDSNTNHPAGTGQRAIVFKGNRLHSIGTRFIKFLSGHGYGFTFQDNTIDNGKGWLFQTEEKAVNWIVTGNLVQGIEDKNPIIWFKNGAENCLIANNVFSSDPYYWYPNKLGRNRYSPPVWIKIDGTAEGTSITGNTFKRTSSCMILLQIAEGINISGNVFDSPCLNNITDMDEYDDEDEPIDDEPVPIMLYESAVWVNNSISKSCVCNNTSVSHEDSETHITTEYPVISAASGVSLDGCVRVGNYPVET